MRRKGKNLGFPRYSNCLATRTGLCKCVWGSERTFYLSTERKAIKTNNPCSKMTSFCHITNLFSSI